VRPQATSFRKPERFGQLLMTSECDFRGRGYASHDFRTGPWPQGPVLQSALAAARAVKAGEVALRYADNKERIPEAVHAARVSAVKAELRDVRD
jgi:tRNA nucleotidyltransferase (CCA-adding enzyme)